MEENKITYNVKKMRIGEHVNSERSKYYPVFSEEGEELYCVSADRKDLRVDIKTLLRGGPRRRLRKEPRTPEVSFERNNYIHTRIACNVPDFHDEVETLILNTRECHEDELFAFDAAFLLSIFPKLKTVCCHDSVAIENATSALRVLDPFEVGEYSFELAKMENYNEANRYLGMLWILDRQLAKFWGKVAREYNRKPVDHPDYDPNEPVSYGGMDRLFYVYLLGWYSDSFPIYEDHIFYVKKQKNLDKAIALLPIRFQNCDLHEVAEALYWDIQHVREDENPDFDDFFKVLVETELLFPGAAEGIYKDGWIDYDNYDQLCENLWSTGDKMTAETIRGMIDSGADAQSVQGYLNRMSAVSCDAAYTLYELYKTGHVDTMIAVQDFTLDFPELKNAEKAAEHAQKCNIKHNI